jgi:hypothetical protein
MRHPPVVGFTGEFLQVDANLLPFLQFLPPELLNVSSTFNSDLVNLPIVDTIGYLAGPSSDSVSSQGSSGASGSGHHATETPAEAATKFCEDHGQVASTIRGTNIPITASLSATAGPVNYNTKNEITPVIPAFPWPEWLSFGAGVDVGINVPTGSAPSWSIGLGKNLGVSFFTDAQGKTTGVNINIGLSIGPPVTVSPGSANACGLRAGG